MKTIAKVLIGNGEIPIDAVKTCIKWTPGFPELMNILGYDPGVKSGYKARIILKDNTIPDVTFVVEVIDTTNIQLSSNELVIVYRSDETVEANGAILYESNLWINLKGFEILEEGKSTNMVILSGEDIMSINDTNITENDVSQLKVFYKADGSRAYGNADINTGKKKVLFSDRILVNWEYHHPYTDEKSGEYRMLGSEYGKLGKFIIAANNISRMFGQQVIDPELNWRGLAGWSIKIGDWEFFPTSKVLDLSGDYSRFSSISAEARGLIEGQPEKAVPIEISLEGWLLSIYVNNNQHDPDIMMWAEENWNYDILRGKEISIISNFGIQRIWSMKEPYISIEHDQMLDFENGLVFEIRTGPVDSAFSNSVIWEKRPARFQVSYATGTATSINRIRTTTYTKTQEDDDQGNKLTYELEKCYLADLRNTPFTITEQDPTNWNQVTGVYKIL